MTKKISVRISDPCFGVYYISKGLPFNCFATFARMSQHRPNALSLVLNKLEFTRASCNIILYMRITVVITIVFSIFVKQFKIWKRRVFCIKICIILDQGHPHFTICKSVILWQSSSKDTTTQMLGEFSGSKICTTNCSCWTETSWSNEVS